MAQFRPVNEVKRGVYGSGQGTSAEGLPDKGATLFFRGKVMEVVFPW